MWSALRMVQAATSIGRIGLESLALAAPLMSALGQKQTSETSAQNVRFIPKADIDPHNLECLLCARSGHNAWHLR